jgi:tellurite methyltransferase
MRLEYTLLLKFIKEVRMDKIYWNNYYQKHGRDKGISQQSSFAKFSLDNFFTDKKLNIVELGSGNCRDAIFLAHHGHYVTAIDQSTAGIDIERRTLHAGVAQNLNLKALDFIREDYTQYGEIDVFYSRFTMHSITKEDEALLLPNVYSALTRDGLFCIEVRTTKDPLFGVGEPCGDNTFISDNHKRRFIDSEEFRDQVSVLGFKELYFSEENNLSIYKNDNPVLMRIILQK